MAKGIVEPLYYPPRARGSRQIRETWWRLRRGVLMRVRREAFAPPPDMPSQSRMFLWLAIPGAFCFHRRQIWLGSAILGIWCGALLWSVVTLGLPSAWWAMVLASSLHSLMATVAFSVTKRPGSNGLGPSIGGFTVMALVYWWLFPACLHCVVFPVSVREKLVLINPWSREIHRGDWSAFRSNYRHWAAGDAAARALEGYVGELGYDQVLGLPGETVKFQPESIEINGVRYEKPAGQMPSTGELEVPQDSYFIWPSIVIMHGFADPEGMLQNMAIVPKGAIIGKPYHRWFFQVQEVAPLQKYTGAAQGKK